MITYVFGATETQFLSKSIVNLEINKPNKEFQRKRDGRTYSRDLEGVVLNSYDL